MRFRGTATLVLLAVLWWGYPTGELAADPPGSVDQDKPSASARSDERLSGVGCNAYGPQPQSGAGAPCDAAQAAVIAPAGGHTSA